MERGEKLIGKPAVVFENQIWAVMKIHDLGNGRLAYTVQKLGEKKRVVDASQCEDANRYY